MTKPVRIILLVLVTFAALIVLMMSMLIAGRATTEVDVSEPVSVDAPAVETTAPSQVEHELVVSEPQVGGLVTSPITIEGTSNVDEVGYRIVAGGSLLVEGTIKPDPGGRFSTVVEFVNDCCVELTLEVFDVQPYTGLKVAIPLTYPEDS